VRDFGSYERWRSEFPHSRYFDAAPKLALGNDRQFSMSEKVDIAAE
jgi:hypothetical protein